MAKETTLNDFGLLIAYVLPGFAALWGIAQIDPSLQFGLLWASSDQPTIAGFLYSTVAAVSSGLMVSTVRWLTIDPLLHATGVEPPDWDFAQLESKVDAFNVLVEGHYRFYLWYANSFIAILWVLIARRIVAGSVSHIDGWDLCMLLALPVLFLGARDTLKKYYMRAGRLLGRRRKQ